jgi:hypothetical protein
LSAAEDRLMGDGIIAVTDTVYLSGGMSENAFLATDVIVDPEIWTGS